ALLWVETEARMSSRDGHFARRATEDDDEHDDKEHAGDEDGEPGREPLRNARAADRGPLPQGHQLPGREGRTAQARRRDRTGHARERALVREYRGLQRERARVPRTRRRDARRGRAGDGPVE